jgi:serpin B
MPGAYHTTGTTTFLLFLSLLFNVHNIHGRKTTIHPFRNVSLAAAFSKANTEFTLGLMKKIPSDSNIFYSPLSISTVMAMAHLGANAETLTQIGRVLHFDEMGRGVYSAFRSYLRFISNRTFKGKLNTASRIYKSVQNSAIRSFLINSTIYFNTSLEGVDFTQSEETRKSINSWVSKRTENKIQNLIPKDGINNGTEMVLVNAIYFKGNWKNQFMAMDTFPREFKNGKEKIMTKMMHQVNYFRFCNMPDLSLKAIELPYEGNSLSMLIILPMSMTGIENLEKSLTSSVLKNVVNHLKETKVSLFLPIFEMHYSLSMRPLLSAMGMPLPFSNKADFSKMVIRNVSIGNIFHKAFVKVNEKGTEAAAATAVGMFTVAQVRRSKPSYELFKADHPFLVFIRDHVNGVTLFAGRLYSPPQSNSKA